MPHAEAEVTIARSPEDVFDFLAAGQNNPLWRPGVVDISHVSGDALGALWRQGVKGPGGMRVSADYEITEYSRPSVLAFRAVAGPARPEGRYSLEPVGGGTRLSFALSWVPKGLARLMTTPVQKTMEAEVGQLETLKAVLERR
jgi:uncharacterized protein YndB with AHSA1/START domain